MAYLAKLSASPSVLSSDGFMWFVRTRLSCADGKVPRSLVITSLVISLRLSIRNKIYLRRPLLPVKRRIWATVHNGPRTSASSRMAYKSCPSDESKVAETGSGRLLSLQPARMDSYNPEIYLTSERPLNIRTLKTH